MYSRTLSNLPHRMRVIDDESPRLTHRGAACPKPPPHPGSATRTPCPAGYRGDAERKDQLLQALLAGGLDYRSRCETVPIDDENSAREVAEKLDAAYAARADGEEWGVNLTGGRKPMSIGAYIFSTTHDLPALHCRAKTGRGN